MSESDAENGVVEKFKYGKIVISFIIKRFNNFSFSNL